MSVNKTVVHIPHASRIIPVELRDQFRLDDEALQFELLQMTDSYTDDLFGHLEGCQNLIFPVSRLVVDAERYENDGQEPMSRLGMGVIYTKTHDMKPLRVPLFPDEREKLLARYYRPYHALLTARTKPPKSKHPRARIKCNTLLIDAHSYPSKPLPYERNHDLQRPDICIGTTEMHTPAALTQVAEGMFRDAGFTVAVNEPFAGTMVPEGCLWDARVSSIMIEVRRDLYMDEVTGAKLPLYPEFKLRLQRLLNELIAFYWRRQLGPDPMAHPQNELAIFKRSRLHKALEQADLS